MLMRFNMDCIVVTNYLMEWFGTAGRNTANSWNWACATAAHLWYSQLR